MASRSGIHVRFAATFAALFSMLLGCGPGARPFTPPAKGVSEARTFRYRHNISLFRVSNGMTVATIPDKNTNLVQVDMRYLVGAAEDPKGKEGLAHLVEHIMFELQTADAPATITDRLREHALFHNASTTWDATNYTATGVASSLESLLTIERDRLAADCSMLDDALLAREREIVRQEIAWRYGDKPTANDVLRAELLGDAHAYTRPVGGTDASVASIEREDVCTFMKQHYAPDRAILVVSGNVDAENLPNIVGPMFGPIETRAAGQRRPVEKPSFYGLDDTIELDIEDPAVLIAFRYPAWGSDELVHADLLTDMLDQELNDAVGSKHLESVTMNIVGGVRARAILWILTPDNVKHRDAMVKLFFKIRDGLLETESDDIFAYRRSSKRASLVQALESFSSRASSVANYLQFTEHMLFMLRDMANLTNLLLPDIKRYASLNYQRKQSRILMIDPPPEDENRELAANDSGLEAPTQELDISTWKSPVAPGEADAPLLLDVQRVHPETERFTLENGLRVILAANFAYPTVDMRMVFPVGDSMDPADKPGLAFWTAALLETKMNQKWSSTLWNQVMNVRRMGGDMDAYTTGRSTVFRNRGLAMYADGLLWQLHWLLESGTAADRLRRSKKMVRKFQKDQKAEQDALEEAEEEPSARYSKTLLAGIFGPNHPYAVDTSLTEIFLKLKPEELESFRNLNYGANGATLIVAGNFDPEELREEITTLFKAWPAKSNAPAITRIPDAEERSKAVHALIVDEDMRHPEITVAFPSSRGLLNDRALRLVAKEMIDQRISSVRERLGASYGVEVSANFSAGPGSLVIRGNVNRDKAPAALKLITEELALLRSGTEIRDDFARARRRILQQVLADTVNATRVAAQLVTEVTYNLPSDHNERLADEISQLTLEQAKAQLAKDLQEEHTVLVIRGPKALGEELLKTIGSTGYIVN